MKLFYLCLIIVFITIQIDCRRMRRGGKLGGVSKTLSGGVVTLINDLREKPIKMPKGYKTEV